MRILFMGTGEIGVSSLKALAARHEICAVVTQPDRPAGRDLKPRPSPIKVAAVELNLPVLQPEKVRRPEVIAELQNLQPDLTVVVAYGQILPRAVLEIPARGCLNIHASLLPKHRGASPIQAAILTGDAQSGITIMWMDEGLDTGDILLTHKIPIAEDETGGSLHDRLAEIAPEALLAALELIEKGEAPHLKQDNEEATYAAKLSRADAEVNWSLPAMEIERRIRALTPWPGSFTFLPDKSLLKIHCVSLAAGEGMPGVVVGASSDGILVATGESGLLLKEVQAAGSRRMTAADFLRGRELAVGIVLGAAKV